MASERRAWVATLTADGHEPYVHRCTTTDEMAAAKFTAEVWLLGHPERRTAENVAVIVEPLSPSGDESPEPGGKNDG